MSWWQSTIAMRRNGYGRSKSSTCARRWDWIANDSPKFGADPSRIVVVGRSAGAQLAMRLAYQEGPSAIRGVVNYYGPVDLDEGWRHPPQPDPANVRGILEKLHRRHSEPEAGAL